MQDSRNVREIDSTRISGRSLTAGALILLVMLHSCLPPLARAEFPLAHLFEKKPHNTHKPAHTHTHHLDPVERLAAGIDELEYHIETYGTIVPKQPDIWGQARLTKHRQEYEREIFNRFSDEKFIAGIQGALRRSDQSFLGAALSLNSLVSAPTQVTTKTTSKATTADGTTVFTPTERTTDSTSPSERPEALANEASDLLPDPAVGDSAIQESLKLSRFDTGGEAGVISLEPVVEIDQLSRYLNHINQLRRINEGDDTADSPGYSLNLVRIPISVLPGERTKKAYGAELTVTADHHLTPDLLPNTFRNLVINDLVDHLAPVLAHLLNDKKARSSLLAAHNDAIKIKRIKQEKLANENEIELLNELRSLNSSESPDDEVRSEEHPSSRTDNPLVKDGQQKALTPKQQREIKEAIQGIAEGTISAQQRSDLFSKEMLPQSKAVLNTLGDVYKRKITARLRQRIAENNEYGRNIADLAETFEARIKEATDTVVQLRLSLPVARQRRARHAFAPSQIQEIVGLEYIACLAIATLKGLENTKLVQGTGVYHYGEIVSFLQDELGAVYELVSHNNAAHLWTTHCTQELVKDIRLRNKAQLANERTAFVRSSIFDGLSSLTNKHMVASETADSKTRDDAFRALAWGVIVVSALLNDHLMQDMHEVSQARNCGCGMGPGSWLDCYMPSPSPDAITAFNEYVRCRWPIIVFALDPVTQDQNIADVFSMRRELQLAAAVAVANGEMGVNAAMRFTRNLEQEMETIQLNRTAISFSHGNDTFGWRFYPRFQTFPTVNNPRVFMQNIWGGPTSKMQRHELRLEPGTRECTAVVIMPAFVPLIEIHTRANWFKLNHPREKELTLQDSIILGRKHQMLQTGFQSICSAGCYRPGDIAQLHRVMTQLDRRMPLQNMLAQVPHENTIGGFELFSNGLTDLAPELSGWYGAPGINPTGHDVCNTAHCDNKGISFAGEPSGAQCAGTCCGTTMFLTGNGFSVHDTNVIAGGRCVPFTLLSRQTMRVVMPGHVASINVDGRRCVDVHIATPYGVSNHLLIPVHLEQTASTALEDRVKRLESQGLSWDKPDVKGCFAYDPNGFVDASTIRIEGVKRALVNSVAGRSINELLKRPETAEVVMKASKSEDGPFDADTLVLLEKELDFTKSRDRADLPANHLANVLQELLRNRLKVNSKRLNRVHRANPAELSFELEAYVQLDTDSRPRKVDNNLKVNLRSLNASQNQASIAPGDMSSSWQRGLQQQSSQRFHVGFDDDQGSVEPEADYSQPVLRATKLRRLPRVDSMRPMHHPVQLISAVSTPAEVEDMFRQRHIHRKASNEDSASSDRIVLWARNAIWGL